MIRCLPKRHLWFSPYEQLNRSAFYPVNRCASNPETITCVLSLIATKGFVHGGDDCRHQPSAPAAGSQVQQQLKCSYSEVIIVFRCVLSHPHLAAELLFTALPCDRCGSGIVPGVESSCNTLILCFLRNCVAFSCLSS